MVAVLSLGLLALVEVNTQDMGQPCGEAQERELESKSPESSHLLRERAWEWILLRLSLEMTAAPVNTLAPASRETI